MAKRFNMKRRRYSEFESGDGEAVGVDVPAVLPLEPHEKCFIYRRRSGWTQQDCADKMGVARYWFMLMETGQAPCERLEAFWNEG